MLTVNVDTVFQLAFVPYLGMPSPALLSLPEFLALCRSPKCCFRDAGPYLDDVHILSYVCIVSCSPNRMMHGPGFE